MSTNMQRRSLLNTLGTLPFIPGVATRLIAPPIPNDEDCMFWWRYVQHAIKLSDPKYCTGRYLNMVVKRSKLDHTSDNEAKRVVRAAFRGAYDERDVPVEHRPSDWSI